MRQAAIGIVYHPLDPKKVLVVQRKDVSIWVFPGGGVDEGEEPKDAVVREILEETGVKTKIHKTLAHYLPANRFSELTHVYECVPIDDTFLTAVYYSSNESKQVCFAKLSDLGDDFFHIHKNWLDEITKSVQLPIRRRLDEVNLFAILKYFFLHPMRFLKFLKTKLSSSS